MRKIILYVISSLTLYGASVCAQDVNATDNAGASDTKSGDVLVEETNNVPKTVKRHVTEPGRTPIVFKRDVLVRSNETAEMVVVIAGSARVDGKVLKDVVVIGGDVQLNGEARDVVAVLGSVKLGPNAKVLRDAAAIGGSLEVSQGATYGRRPFELDLGGLGQGLKKWIIECLFKLRPLAPNVGWAWLMAFLFFVIYLVIALMMPGAVAVCATELRTRPATTFFMGILAKMLVPLIFVILAATGLGAIIIPFLAAAVAFGALIGKTALFAALGAGTTKRFGATLAHTSLIAFLLGIGIITLLYMVPLVGFLTLGVVSVWGLGGAVNAGFGAWRREAPPRANPPSTLQPPGAAAMGGPEAEGAAATGQASATAEPTGAAPISPSPTVVAHVPEALSQRRANFWERMGAGILDLIIVAFIGGLVHGPPQAFIVALAYFAGMWAWKGTTLGGSVLGLKVVRIDGQNLTFVVALVRALASVLSFMALFLGFLWIAWDPEKQAWHDKIAGTVVVRFPRSVPIVVL